MENTTWDFWCSSIKQASTFSHQEKNLGTDLWQNQVSPQWLYGNIFEPLLHTKWGLLEDMIQWQLPRSSSYSCSGLASCTSCYRQTSCESQTFGQPTFVWQQLAWWCVLLIYLFCRISIGCFDKQFTRKHSLT